MPLPIFCYIRLWLVPLDRLVIRRIVVTFFLTFVFSPTIWTNPVIAACDLGNFKWSWCGVEWDNNANQTGLFTCAIYTYMTQTVRRMGYATYQQRDKMRYRMRILSC